ncbi:iron complex transport system substrate-binding protein [Salirhabdus euzebyi]|uniref:Iron complex transport system substrate-binding protein n=1 Tax=Salirhabdus euzebyi TaxID=394506 RepID=A0A841Q8A7_9BACI|nr:cobalamin-binding protein [Salirhabdus euzebyi]MBB6454638.1 iron complex transport system substrate-binding protein [Salirhabdus euzebyi]
MRIISICPSNTEILAYLGLTSQVVGVDDFSDWPNGINHLPRLGPDLNINMDKVEQLKPDIVLASLSVPGMEKMVEELEKRKIPHITLNPNSLEEIGNSLLLVGKHLGVEDQAKHVFQKYNRILETYRKLSHDIAQKRKLYWEWWPKPVFTPGKHNWLTEISELAGGINVFSTENVASFSTSWEDVKSRDPDYICMVWVGVQTEKMNPSLIRKRPGWHEMRAIKGDKIIILDEDLYCRPSPRLMVGLQKLAAILHPEKFPPYELGDSLLD